ncbi:hypothetical protein MRX96_029551 [Rhipicephalus microplus]
MSSAPGCQNERSPDHSSVSTKAGALQQLREMLAKLYAPKLCGPSCKCESSLVLDPANSDGSGLPSNVLQRTFQNSSFSSPCSGKKVIVGSVPPTEIRRPFSNLCARKSFHVCRQRLASRRNALQIFAYFIKGRGSAAAVSTANVSAAKRCGPSCKSESTLVLDSTSSGGGSLPCNTLE